MSKKKSAWKYWLIPFYPICKFIRFINTPSPAKDPMVQQLENAAKRAAWGHSGSASTPVKSDNTTYIRLDDGTELHTEERPFDYKTYIYDKDGKCTGLHMSGDKIYDDKWNEQGYFDSNGKFIPKN